MGVESVADQAAFLNPKEFAVVAVLCRTGALSQEIQGIFTKDPAVLLESFDGPIMGTATSFLVSAVDAELAQIDDVLFVNDTRYHVVKIEAHNDGGGMIRLMLEVAE